MKSVLIIDDDKLLSSALSDALTAAGYETHQAADGESGLAEAYSIEPDLVLLDYQLPGISGIDVLAELRKNAWGENAKVIFMTNTNDVSVVNQVIAHGVGEYLVKSDTSLDEIVNIVNRHLSPNE